MVVAIDAEITKAYVFPKLGFTGSTKVSRHCHYREKSSNSLLFSPFMAAKLLLHTLADENSDLQKKIGCINGIFQIFDRHHVLTSRRQSLTLGNHNPIKLTNK